jgi:hypothetical protein
MRGLICRLLGLWVGWMLGLSLCLAWSLWFVVCGLWSGIGEEIIGGVPEGLIGLSYQAS